MAIAERIRLADKFVATIVVALVPALWAVPSVAAAHSVSAIVLGTLPGGFQTEPWAINDAGQVVGSTYSESGEVHGFLWEDGVMTDLGPGIARSINNRGQVLTDHFIWENGIVTDLGLPPGSGAWGINDLGQVVGSTGSHAFLWQNGVFTDLGTLPGGVDSEAMAINNRGQVVGWSRTPEGSHAVLWHDGTITDLGTLPGGRQSLAWSINERGQVVGVTLYTLGPDLGVVPSSVESRR